MHEAGARLERLGASILVQLEHWRWRAVVHALQALRGISAIHAVRIVAELGDFQRFESPRKLTAYLGPHPERGLLRCSPAPRLDHQGGQQLRPARDGGGRLGLCASCARVLGDRAASDQARKACV